MQHTVHITTFGYLHDDPPPAHLTLDLRTHFRDPHVAPGLRYLTARDVAVRQAVLSTPGIGELLTATTAAVRAYLSGPSAGPVTVAVGCAGGRHRAGVVGQTLAEALTGGGQDVTLTHRDLDKPVVDRPITPITYTHPDVLTTGVAEGWAEAETDPTRIDWPARQAAAAIPFEVVDGRPVNPCERTAVRYGRNELGHWGEQLAADTLVSALDYEGHRWILMVERADGHGWALPGGYVDPGETPLQTAVRELAEETGLTLPGAAWHAGEPRYVPDPRASDEAWMVTVPCTVDLGVLDREAFPPVAGGDDAARAEWIPAGTYDALAAHLAEAYGGRVFAAHVDMLQAHL